MLSEKAKENKRKYNHAYTKENYKRVSLLVSPGMFDDIKTASAKEGESINGYIKKAISDRLDKSKDL